MTNRNPIDLIDGLPWDSSKRFPREPMERFMLVFRSVAALAFLGIGVAWFVLGVQFDDWLAVGLGAFWAMVSVAYGVAAWLRVW